MMADDDRPTERDQLDDVELALRMMDGDENALSYVVSTYGPKVMGALRGKYRNYVQDDVLKDAINQAAFSVWQNADILDPSKGSLGGFFYRCACNAVINILRQGDKAQPISLDDLDMNISSLQTASPNYEEAQLTPEKQKILKDLHEAIEALPEMQRAIVEADLVAGCYADNDYLAKTLSTTKNSIYVLRNKARVKIRLEMQKRGHYNT
ncbi:MAG: sigma-70 family RNA polymerase sigma factor [Candidatus Hydrogenedentes bacterium]|nr:sigma-70 family RNA polymerase sigma factor [Candidatus Hydrogenedentota bacterium]